MTLAEVIQAAVADGSRFTVDGYSGVAFYLVEAEMVADEDTVWTGQRVETGRLVMVMVGDDRRYVVDPDDVAVLGDSDYCHECGQVGCTADGR